MAVWDETLVVAEHGEDVGCQEGIPGLVCRFVVDMRGDFDM